MESTHATEFDAVYSGMLAEPGSAEYQASWRQFWALYEPRIRQWGREHRLETNQVDEVVSDVMLKLVKLMPSFQYDSEKGFSPWLRQVTHNLIVDLWNRKARYAGQGGTDAVELLNQHPQSEATTDALESILGTALDDFFAKVRQQAEDRVKANVKSTTWRAYELLEKHNLTGKQVAEQTGLSIVNAFTARGRVKKSIDAEMMKLGIAMKSEIC